MVGKDGDGIPLAWLSVYGTWDTSQETSGARRSWINRLDKIAKQHDMDYDKAKSLKDKHAADRKMVAKINNLPGKKTQTENIVKNIMRAKLKIGV